MSRLTFFLLTINQDFYFSFSASFQIKVSKKEKKRMQPTVSGIKLYLYSLQVFFPFSIVGTNDGRFVFFPVSIALFI